MQARPHFTRQAWHITHGHRRNVFKTLKSVIAAVALQDLIPAAVFEEFLME